MTVGLLVYMGSCKGSATMGAIGNFLWFVLGGVFVGAELVAPWPAAGAPGPAGSAHREDGLPRRRRAWSAVHAGRDAQTLLEGPGAGWCEVRNTRSTAKGGSDADDIHSAQMLLGHADESTTAIDRETHRRAAKPIMRAVKAFEELRTHGRELRITVSAHYKWKWRRDRDSNPGYVAVYLISSQAPSTTRPSLRDREL